MHRTTFQSHSGDIPGEGRHLFDVKAVLILYLFFVSFSEAFALGQWLTLPVILASILVILVALRLLAGGRIRFDCYKKEDTLVILMFLGIILSGIVAPNSKTFNYILGYFFIFFILYLFMKGAFLNYLKYQSILNANSVAVIFVSLFCIVDLLGWAIAGLDIQSYIPRAQEARATISIFRRSYGFATEPTILAFYFNTLGILGIWNILANCNLRIGTKAVATTVFGLAWISTFSAAGIGGAVMAFLISSVLFKLRRWKIKEPTIRNLVKRGLILGLLLTAIITDARYWNVIPGIVSKLTFESHSAVVRLERWQQGLSDIENNPLFGSGIGATSAKGEVSNINWYIFLTQEAGVVASIPIFLFLFIVIMRIYLSEVPGRNWYMISALSGIFHLFAISTFFHPFLWTHFAIFFVADATNSGKRKQ